MDEKDKNAEVLEGGEGNDSQETNDNTVNDKSNAPAGAGNDKKEKTFTQEQVNRMMAREKNQGRAAAYKDLGIDPKDTRMIKMFQAFVESQKTDDQKNSEKAMEEAKKAAETEHRVLVAEAKAEAMILGVKSQYVEDAVALALSRMTDSADIKTVLTELKDKYSIWFAEEEDDKKQKSKTGQKGTGAAIKETNKNGTMENKGLGARLAAQRTSNNKKSSFWGA